MLFSRPFGDDHAEPECKSRSIGGGGLERFGGWWPLERPSFFLRPVQVTADEARAAFGPADRVPLFEAAFHDSIISTDR